MISSSSASHRPRGAVPFIGFVAIRSPVDPEEQLGGGRQDTEPAGVEIAGVGAPLREAKVPVQPPRVAVDAGAQPQREVDLVGVAGRDVLVDPADRRVVGGARRSTAAQAAAGTSARRRAGSGRTVSSRPSNIANHASGSGGERVVGARASGPAARGRDRAPPRRRRTPPPTGRAPRPVRPRRAPRCTSSGRRASSTPAGPTSRKLGLVPRQVVEAGLDHGVTIRGGPRDAARGSLVAMPSVLVAMSGGVDSSVAACLLAEQGYEVVGSHMSLVHLDGVEHGCCGPAARADAAAVAAIGGFPFEICDLTDGLRRGRDRRLRRRACGRTHPEPVRAMQRRDQVRRVPAPGRRARRSTSSRPATTCAAVRDDRGRVAPASRRGPREGPELHAPHARPGAARPRRCFPVGGLPKAADAGARGAVRAAGRDEARLAGALLRAERRRGRLRAVAQAPALVHAGGEVVDPDGRVLGRARRHVRLHGGTAPRPRRGHRVARVYVLEVDAADEPRRRRARRAAGQAGPGRRPGLVGRRAAPPADGPFEAEVRIRYRGDDVPRGGRRRTDDGFEVVVPRAAARGGARAERGRLPRRRAPRRRPDRARRV